MRRDMDERKQQYGSMTRDTLWAGGETPSNTRKNQEAIQKGAEKIRNHTTWENQVLRISRLRGWMMSRPSGIGMCLGA